MTGFEILVDPARMLTVQYNDPRAGTIELAVITCRYIPTTTRTGERRIAIEVLLDPAETEPHEPYQP